MADTRQALTNILNQEIVGEQPGEISFSVNQIHSEDQLRLALGANFALNKLADIKASFSFDNRDEKTRVVVKFLQKYYTADMNVPENGVFVEEVPDPTKFGGYSPVYVSSLTFGRMGLFFLESSYSASEVKAALEGVLNSSASVGFGGSVSGAYKDILNSSKIKVYTTGGSGGSAVEVVRGYEGFIDFIKSGGKFNKDSRGAILSYQLRNLSDYSIFQTKLTSTYEVRNCSPVNQIGDGQLIGNSDTGELFIFLESTLRSIPSKPVLNNLFEFRLATLIYYTTRQLQYVRRGIPISEDSELVMSFLSRKVYLREKNTLRLIPNKTIGAKYHFNYDKCRKLFYLGKFDFGPDIR